MFYHFFRKRKKIKTTDEPLLQGSRTWHMSAEKNRHQKVADQHCLQVLTIWSALDLSMDAITDVVRVRDEWLSSVEERYVPGSEKLFR
jgi:hypothetical protein